MKISSLLFFTFLSLSTLAQMTVKPKVIYGIDDRMDVYESSDNLMKELSRSTAAMIPNRNIVEVNGNYEIKSETLSDTGICKSERFSNQPAAGDCSGFLVAPDVMVTAGHCVRSLSTCDETYWVFDYANITSEVAKFSFSKDQVFRCKEILAKEKDPGTLSDYAVVRLDRSVPGRLPLKFRKEGRVSNDSVLTVLGYPSGLPLKITTGAVIRNNTNNYYFNMNSDTYGGNSGSAVVDTKTGLVEGILVRGDTDYERTTTGEFCSISVVRGNTEGRGEDATRITVVKALPR